MSPVETALLGSDEGVFVVRSACGSLQVQPGTGNTLLEVPEGVASGGELWVLTGDQWGPFSVTTELTDTAPGEPDTGWEDVVELSVTTTGPMVVTELVENDPQVPLTMEPGSYRVRVSARGRTASADGNQIDDAGSSAEPVEWYLLQAWPAPPAEAAVILLDSAFARKQLAGDPPPLRVPEAEAGIAASVRIGRDVDGKPGARTLSGEVGTVEVARTIRGTRRKLFFTVAHSSSWTDFCVPGYRGWMYGGPGGPDYALGEPHYFGAGDDSVDQLSGSPGEIRWSFLEVDKPARAVRAWNWLPGIWQSQRPPGSLLDQDTVVTTTLVQSKDEAGAPWTTIRVRHEGLPVEWLEDMEAWWSLQLAVADHADFGRR